MNFQTKLTTIQEKNNSLLCVGLDPVAEKIPEQLKKEVNSFFAFNKAVIDATHQYVCAYKPNSAFYEALGEKGIGELKMTCDYLQQAYPELPIILDAKRGDIGNTNNGYVQFAFDYLHADAITVMPYMGIESLDGFFQRDGKGVIVGCHSSNPGAKEFQELEINGKPLYQHIAMRLVEKHGNNPNCMIFMGATYPQQLKLIRGIAGDMTMLVPGVGAQEGILEQTVRMGINSQRRGMVINASRSILYASGKEDFTEKAAEEAKRMQEAINTYR